MAEEEKNSRYIPISTRIILYSQAAGQCSMDNCNTDLFPISNGKSHLGNIAHIEALNKGGAMYNPNSSVEERNSEENLMIVCKNCHEIIDADPEKYTVGCSPKLIFFDIFITLLYFSCFLCILS